MTTTTVQLPQSIWRTLLAEARPAISLFLVLSLITGLAYPLLVTGVAQGLFADKANGSLILKDGKALGSSLIGQPFSDVKYLWGRPSATGPQPYNALASSGSNLGPLNPALVDTVKARIAEQRAANPAQTGPVPQELVTASASGLDPHISPAAARWQIARIAQVRGLPAKRVQAIIEACTEQPALGLFGEARVNVLQVNLALDALK